MFPSELSSCYLRIKSAKKQQKSQEKAAAAAESAAAASPLSHAMLRALAWGAGATAKESNEERGRALLPSQVKRRKGVLGRGVRSPAMGDDILCAYRMGGQQNGKQ